MKDMENSTLYLNKYIASKETNALQLRIYDHFDKIEFIFNNELG